MHGFEAKDLVDTGAGFTLQRRDHLIGIDVEGVVDDAISDAWRAALAAEIRRRGHPKFLAIDFSRCDPQNSMSARFRTAAFAREHMRTIDWAVLLTGNSPGPLVVVRAVLRTLGLPNLQMTTDAAYFRIGIDRMLRGQRPPADPSAG
jgi:hypothetical protein